MYARFFQNYSLLTIYSELLNMSPIFVVKYYCLDFEKVKIFLLLLESDGERKVTKNELKIYFTLNQNSTQNGCKNYVN